MEVIKNILITYWPQILAALLFVLSFILQLIKKKPVKVVSNVIEFLFETSVQAIKFVEDAFKELKASSLDGELNNALCASIPVGPAKLSAALEYIQEKFIKVFPELDFLKFRETAISIIENILSTPQKHDNK